VKKPRTPRRAHDRSRRLLYHHPRTVRDLVRGFVPESWVDEIDFATLTRVPSDHISAMLPGEFEERTSDVLWKVRWKGRKGKKGKELYLLILVELQSSCEQAMVLRVLGYIVMFYLRLVKERPLKEGGRLPPVLPFVVYNGEVAWWAPLRFEDLVEEVPESFRPHVPSMTCCLVDEKRVSTETLQALAENVEALLCRTRQSAKPEGFRAVVEDVRRWLSGPEDRELLRDLVAWFSKVVIPLHFPGIEASDLEDVHDLTSFVEANMTNFIAQAQAKGHQEGLADAVLRLLNRKFSEVSGDVRSRVQSADAEQLGLWIDRVLTAGSVEEVFASEAQVS
jgi:hypothetical protein